MPETELRVLLLSLFAPDELRIFLADTYGAEFLNHQPVRDTPENLAFSVVQSLRRVGGLNERLFQAMGAARPMRVPDILRVQRRFYDADVPPTESLRVLIEEFDAVRRTTGSTDRRTATLDDIGFRMVETASRLNDWPYHLALVGGTLGERMSGYSYAFAHAARSSERVALMIAIVLSSIEDAAFGQYWGFFTLETIELSTAPFTDRRIAVFLERVLSTLPLGSGRRRMAEGTLERMRARST